MIDDFVNSYLGQKYESLADSLRDTSVKFHSLGSDIRKVYQIGRRIDLGNRSTFAQVRVATNIKLQVRRAIKTYSFCEAQLEGATIAVPSMPGLSVEAVLREVEALSRIDSQYVTECYDVYYDRGFFHIILELCKGGDLHDLLKREHKLTERQSLLYFSQLMLALSKINEAGFAHRALCLENILLSDEEGSKVKIISFGSVGAITPAGFSAKYGSPLYMAPEVFGGAYNESVDVWSLGVILYTMIFGSQPFYATNLDTLTGLISSLNFPKPPRWKHLNTSSIELISSSLKKPRKKASEIVDEPSFKLLLEQEARITQRRTTRVSMDISTEPESAIKMMSGARLRVAVMNYMSQHRATSESFSDLQDLFHAASQSEDGMISEAEVAQTLVEFYSHVGIRLDAVGKARNIVNLLDTTKTGYVKVADVINHFSHDAASDTPLRAAFETFNPDHSATVSLEELRDLFAGSELNSLSMKIESRMESSSIQGVTFEEFIVLLQS